MEQEKAKIFGLITSEEKFQLKKNGKRRRKKSEYKKISNNARQSLIEMVYLKNYLLKDSAKILGINYSTAKTIIRIFRIEKRIQKKCSEPEQVQALIWQAEGPLILQNAQKLQNSTKVNNFQQICAKSSNSLSRQTTVSKESPKDNGPSTHDETFSIPDNLNEADRDMIAQINLRIKELNGCLSNCTENIKMNQVMLNKMASSMKQMNNYNPIRVNPFDQVEDHKCRNANIELWIECIHELML